MQPTLSPRDAELAKACQGMAPDLEATKTRPAAQPLPTLPEEFGRAITRLCDAQFAAGAWRRDESDESYDALHDGAVAAERTLRELIAQHLQLARGARDMLLESAKQHRQHGDPGHARMCDAHAEAITRVQPVAATPQPETRRTPPPINAGLPWQPQEDERIRERVAAASSAMGVDRRVFRELAEALGRTPFGVEQRAIRLGVHNPTGVRP